MRKLWSKIKDGLRYAYCGPWWRRMVAWPAAVIAVCLLLLMAVDINLLWLFGRSPGFSEIKNPARNEASIIFSADSVQIGTFYNENRLPVSYDEISPILVRTLISTEDARFYHHHGIDFTGLGAAVKDMFTGNARGASTITQQLAKNLFRVRTNKEYSTGLLGKIPGVNILIYKVKEWIVALKLEMVFSKEEILTMYFNTVDFGSNAYGIKTACETYFNTIPANMTYEQSATLIGLLKATNTYNPRRNPEASRNRRNVVLDLVFENRKMVIDGEFATRQQLDSIKALPIVLAERTNMTGNGGLVPYFRKALEGYIQKLCEWGCIEGYDSEHKLDVYRAGLRIYTTLDMRMQRYAEQAAMQHMRSLQAQFRAQWAGTSPWQNSKYQEIPRFIENIAKQTRAYKYYHQLYDGNEDSIYYYLNQPHPVKVFTYAGPEERNISTMDSIRYMVSHLHCGFVAIEPDTREVKAWVGDVDYSSWEYDKVLAQHQPGSTFKLFVYTEAMNQGLNPTDRRVDENKVYGAGTANEWRPMNASRSASGANLMLKSAFARSLNTVAAGLGVELGIHNVAKTAYAMGIQSKLDEQLSLSLGSSPVSVLELVNAYCTVVNDGRYNMPILISRIEDRNGNLVYQSRLENKQAIPYRSAFLMQKMLQGGLTEPGGTSMRMWQYIYPIQNTGTEFGGKTGTTNNSADGWYMGVTPGLVGGAWVGGEYGCIHLRYGASGGSLALPIFGQFIQKVLKDQRFKKYWRQFDKEPKEDIPEDAWAGYGDWEPDTLDVDSLDGFPVYVTEDDEQEDASPATDSGTGE